MSVSICAEWSLFVCSAEKCHSECTAWYCRGLQDVSKIVLLNLGWQFNPLKMSSRRMFVESINIWQNIIFKSMLFYGSEPRLALYSSLKAQFRHFRKNIKKWSQKGSSKVVFCSSRFSCGRLMNDWLCNVWGSRVIRKLVKDIVTASLCFAAVCPLGGSPPDQRKKK